MKLNLFGRMGLALLAALALGLGMTACGGGTIAYLWTFGSQYNQIVGYKVDNYSGNLTQVIGSPFSIGFTNPVNMVVRPGGRFVYVFSKGTGGGPGVRGTGSGITVFSVGNDGVLTAQQTYTSQGYVPVWLQIDGTGSYLYALDQYAPDSKTAPYYGSITVFQIDASTGRLNIVLNQQVKDPNDPTGQLQLSYFPVGSSPVMSHVSGSCLYTADTYDNTVFPYVIGGGGQLTLTTTGAIQTGAAQITSINGGSNYIFLTDANNGSTTANYIYPYTSGAGCSLNALTGGRITNYTGTANPSNTLLDNAGRYLYVLNKNIPSGNSPTQTASSITGFNLTNGEFVLNNNPISTVGSGPTCMVEDPTNQWMYVSDMNDGTVTGKSFNATTGTLAQLSRGSSFPATGTLSCLALSPNVD